MQVLITNLDANFSEVHPYNGGPLDTVSGELTARGAVITDQQFRMEFNVALNLEEEAALIEVVAKIRARIEAEFTKARVPIDTAT